LGDRHSSDIDYLGLVAKAEQAAYSLMGIQEVVSSCVLSNAVMAFRAMGQAEDQRTKVSAMRSDKGLHRLSSFEL